jgi:hypothetical protein
MRRVLMVRGLTLEVAPLLAAAAIAGYAQRFATAAFIAAGLLILLGAALCIRDGVVLMSKAGRVTERREEPVTFWLGMMYIHFVPAASCFFAAAYSVLHKT